MHIPALTAELFPPNELPTRLSGLQPPCHDSWLVLAHGNKDDTKPGKEGAGAETGCWGLLSTSQGPATEVVIARRLFPTHSGSLGFLTSLLTPKSFKLL